MRLPKLVRITASRCIWIALICAVPLCAVGSPAQNPPHEKIIIDTDIGDDIDDAFALALALRSPEVQIVGITTTFGDTETRAKLVDRMLGEAGRQDIPVAVGVHTDAKTSFGQRPYADGGPFARSSHPAATCPP